jgi:hypothetical protein
MVRMNETVSGEIGSVLEQTNKVFAITKLLKIIR